MTLRLLIGAIPLANAIIEQLFTTNAVCKQQYCINPVFPGLMEFKDLGNMRWMKQNATEIAPVLDFCGQLVTYDPGLPMPNKTDSSRYNPDDVMESAIEHDRAAAELYFFHLQGMGVEAWDHREPFNTSTHPLRPCARSVARLACFTYFPKAALTASMGQEIAYMRPCSSCCQEYIQACQVECCDESVSCVFSRSYPANAPATSGASPTTGALDSSNKVSLLSENEFTGFAQGTAPSLTCTGTAEEKSGAIQRSFGGAFAVVAAIVFVASL